MKIYSSCVCFKQTFKLRTEKSLNKFELISVLPYQLNCLLASEVLDVETEQFHVGESFLELVCESDFITRIVFAAKELCTFKFLAGWGNYGYPAESDDAAKVSGEFLAMDLVFFYDSKWCLAVMPNGIDFMATFGAMEIDDSVDVDEAQWHGIGVVGVAKHSQCTRGGISQYF